MCAPIFAHRWFERKSKCRDSGKQAIHNLWITQTFLWPARVWGLTKRQKLLCRTGWKACYFGILSVHYISALIWILYFTQLCDLLSFSKQYWIYTDRHTWSFSLFEWAHHIKWHGLFKSLHIYNFDTRWNWACSTHHLQHLKHCYHCRDHAIRHAHQEYSVIFQQKLSKNDLPLPWTKYFPLLYTKFVPSKTQTLYKIDSDIQ